MFSLIVLCAGRTDAGGHVASLQVIQYLVRHLCCWMPGAVDFQII
jgi:hypothetical protein